MTRKEYAAKYGVSERVMRSYNLGQLDAASEEARELLLGLSKRKGPSRVEVKANMTRLAGTWGAARAARQFGEAMSEYSGFPIDKVG